MCGRRSERVVVVSPGFQADARTLHKVLQQRYVQYQFSHRKVSAQQDPHRS